MTAKMINMALEDARLEDLELETVQITNDFVDAYFQMYSKILMF